jgi:hypothetical protein
MSLESQSIEAPAPSNDPIRPGDLAGLFRAELDAESSPAPAPAQVQPEAPIEAAPEMESAPEADTAQPDQAEPSEQEPATPDIDPPRSMSAEERALFEQLPPQAKAWLAKRDKEAQADYTRKTQEVAEQRKEYEAARSRVMEQLQQYDQVLSHFTARPLSPPDPALKHTDPLTYEDQLASYIQDKHNQELAQAEQARVRAEYEANAKAAQQQYWAEQNKKLQELAPKLAERTPEAEKARTSVFEYATKMGYSKAQLDNASAVDLVTLWKAQQFDAAMSKKPVAPAQQAPAPRVMQPGPARAVARNTGVASAVRALSENPSRAALAAAYRAELAAER